MFIKVWKPLSSKRVKNLERKLERESSKKTISTNGELGPLKYESQLFQLIATLFKVESTLWVKFALSSYKSTQPNEELLFSL